MRRSRSLLFRFCSLAFLLAFLSPCGKERGELTGKVLCGGEPVAGAKVEVYITPGEFGGGAPFAVGETDASGMYRVRTGPGEFYVVARKTVYRNGRQVVLRGRPGKEPVLPGKRVPNILLEEMGGVNFEPDGETFVKGKVTGNVEGVYVYAYDGEGKTTWGPGFLAEVPVSGDGDFILPLREGKFHIIAMRKETGSDVGPPEEEGRGVYGGNPLFVKKGTTLDVGVIRLESPDPASLAERRKRGGVDEGRYFLSGIVVDEYGKSMGRIYVMAYDNGKMRGRPLSVAESEVGTGKFTLFLPGPGTYYVGARQTLGGPSSPGELTGVYEATPDHSVVLRGEEKVEDLKIVVREKW